MSSPIIPPPSASSGAGIPRIFVSHSHQDNAFGIQLVQALRSALGGGDDTVWFDISGGAHGGDTLWRKIVQEITDRPVFLVVASPQSLASPWVMNEINLAWTLKNTRPNRHIIPVLYQACDLPADLLMQLYISFLLPQPFEAGVAALVAAIHALTGSRPTPPVGASGGRPPTPATVPAPITPPTPADPQAAAVADLLPGIRDAAARRDWSRLIDKADALLSEAPDATPAEVYRLLGGARYEMGDFARARQALDTALARGRPDVPTWTLAARVCLRLNDPPAAESHLKKALARVDAPAERLPILRDYCAALIQLQQWDELLRRAEEGERLAPDESFWSRVRLRALTELHRDAEALAALRTLTARSDATAADWLARAHLAYTAANETPTDEVRAALDAAARLLPASDPALAQARRELLPPPPPQPAPPPAPPVRRIALPTDRLPVRLVEAAIGFAAYEREGVAFILPPVCTVPAGPFQYGEGSATRTVDLPAFQIARYPVTVAEYACFVRAGQHEPSHAFYGVDWSTQLTRLDHPVTCVSWHDATAYAEWLARLSGQPWHLPSEEEWEKAARWDPRSDKSLVYPWGDTFDAARCNTIESGIGTTTPVGKYGASGASPCGAEEMAGNVWEWTNSTWDDSTQDRVLRGGSWLSGAQNARAAYRRHSRPDSVNGNIGFRLVVAPPARAGSL